MTRKPISLKPILPNGMELNLNGPDFSKLKYEQPLPDTAVVLQQIEGDANATEAIRTTRIKTLGIP
jgi:hypothetical protein